MLLKMAEYCDDIKYRPLAEAIQNRATKDPSDETKGSEDAARLTDADLLDQVCAFL